MTGILIEVCGLDGSGKTTLINDIQDTGYDAVFTREPYNRTIGEEYRHIPDYNGVCYSFAVDRHYHMKEVIIPALNQGKTVICDRGLHCNLAYQAYEGATMEWIMHIQSPIMVMPDAIIFLRGNSSVCAERAGEWDSKRLGDIQELYLRAFALTPDIPVYTFPMYNNMEMKQRVIDVLEKIRNESNNTKHGSTSV